MPVTTKDRSCQAMQKKGSTKYGMHYIYGNSQPYFSITNRNGADHEGIVARYPELEPLIKWHLCGQDGTPMYYFENGMFRWIESKKAAREGRMECAQEEWKFFLSTVVATKPMDIVALASIEDETEMREYLKARLPKVQEAFRAEMAAFDIEDIILADGDTPMQFTGDYKRTRRLSAGYVGNCAVIGTVELPRAMDIKMARDLVQELNDAIAYLES